MAKIAIAISLCDRETIFESHLAQCINFACVQKVPALLCSFFSIAVNQRLTYGQVARRQEYSRDIENIPLHKTFIRLAYNI